MNLYLFGGSFDPPHLGHNEIIKYFLDKSDIFLISPSYYSPFKEKKPKVSYSDRKIMLELMLEIELCSKVSILDYEFNNKSIFSVDTIKYLKTKYPNYDINMIVGLDQYNEIEKWKEYEYILDRVNLKVISRPGTPNNVKKYSGEFIEDIFMDVSSSYIRNNMHDINKIQSLLDQSVFKYITQNKLYI